MTLINSGLQVARLVDNDVDNGINNDVPIVINLVDSFIQIESVHSEQIVEIRSQENVTTNESNEIQSFDLQDLLVSDNWGEVLKLHKDDILRMAHDDFTQLMMTKFNLKMLF
jgi:hypothetical protein